ncbi:thioredoxin family protein [Aneurinibacillus sp. Ricciae_BoGa-3]|uniref:thioredoxin family protein n=1 Tax=Aneurinibacillus sp. Ricciae_BoGa-3 TaxID=3022697 RepID=UPI002342815A|nr:thioredoxin family protein [Aneurinibacillus sp. Ricciae_BoGa-3]WCK55296.1 thioredoxin family protein [Aneurinibacillus sp. Ricciae_BoGa-3]
MKELDRFQVEAKVNNPEGNWALYLYTPMCGTCAVAEKMLEIVLATTPDIPLFKSDVNYIAELARSWKVESVPCLMLFETGRLRDKIYAMESVVKLHSLLKPLAGQK